MRISAVDEDDLAVASSSGKGRHDLENPDRVGISFTVEGQVAGDSKGGLCARSFINAGRQCLPANISRKNCSASRTCGIVIGGC